MTEQSLLGSDAGCCYHYCSNLFINQILSLSWGQQCCYITWQWT